MPVYLDEQMIGLASDVIGFPHLLLCLGFVALTEDVNGDHDISGIHLTDIAASKRAFPFFVSELNKGGPPAKINAIYGCCNRSIRYPGITNTTTAWRAEMTEYAALLGFKGPARGFDTSIIAPRDGTYVEYQLSRTGGREIRIYYRRNEKMDYGGGGANLGQVMFSDSTVPEALRNNPKVLAKIKDRIELAASKGSATVRPKKFTGKARTLTEVDYSLRLDEQYVHF